MKKFKPCVFKENLSSHTNQDSKNTDLKDSKKQKYDISKTDKLTLKVSNSNSSNVTHDIEEADYEILGNDNKIDKKHENKFDKIYTKLCPTGTTTIDQLNICKRMMVNMYSVIQRQEKELNIFKSKKQKKNDALDIYIDLLKVSDKIPTLHALELSSWKRISKSTWDRNLGDLSFLTPLILKVAKLNKITKDPIKKTLYDECIMTLYKSLTKLENSLTNYKSEDIGGKRIDKNGKETDNIDYASDKIQYKDFVDKNGYLEIDEKIDRDLENN